MKGKVFTHSSLETEVSGTPHHMGLHLRVRQRQWQEPLLWFSQEEMGEAV